MPRRGICKVEGCIEPRERGAFMCMKHLGESRRCEGKVRSYDPDTGIVLGERQCKNPAMAGLTVCRAHGGNGPRMREASERTPALTAMQRFVKPYEGQISAVGVFEMQIRDTLGRINWLKEMIGGLEDERALIWGQTKEEEIGAGEWTGVNRTYEARIHQFEVMMQWERKHLHELTKTWIRANMDERRLNVLQDNVNYTVAKSLEIAVALGHNANDPEVRSVLARVFKNDQHVE